MFGRIFYFMGQKNNAKKGIAEFSMGCLPDTFDLGNTSLPQVKKKKNFSETANLTFKYPPTNHSCFNFLLYDFKMFSAFCIEICRNK